MRTSGFDWPFCFFDPPFALLSPRPNGLGIDFELQALPSLPPATEVFGLFARTSLRSLPSAH